MLTSICIVCFNVLVVFPLATRVEIWIEAKQFQQAKWVSFFFAWTVTAGQHTMWLINFRMNPVVAVLTSALMVVTLRQLRAFVTQYLEETLTTTD